MKISIINNGTAQNKGCQALTRSTIDLFCNGGYSTEFYILTQSPGYDRKAFSADKAKLTFMPYPDFSRKASAALAYRNILPASFFEKHVRALAYIFNSDVVISSGGDTLTSDYDPKMLKYYLRLIEYAQDFGKPVYVMAGSIGPFDEDILPYAIRILKSADLITVRESRSHEYLNSIGVNDNVQRTADPAFLMKPEPLPFLDKKLNTERLKIGFSLSRGVIRYSSLDYHDTLQCFMDCFRELEAKYDPLFVLVPHVIDNTNSDNDDREFCDLIYRASVDIDNIIYANQDYKCTELKYIISKCDLFVGARTHSTIAAFSSCVPTISLAYSEKAFGINYDIFGDNKYVLPMKSLTSKQLIKKIELVRTKCESIRETLKHKIPAIQDMAIKNRDYLIERLNLSM